MELNKESKFEGNNSSVKPFEPTWEENDDIITFFKRKGQLMSLKILLDEYLEKGNDITENFLKFTQILLGQITNSMN